MHIHVTSFIGMCFFFLLHAGFHIIGVLKEFLNVPSVYAMFALKCAAPQYDYYDFGSSVHFFNASVLLVPVYRHRTTTTTSTEKKMVRRTTKNGKIFERLVLLGGSKWILFYTRAERLLYRHSTAVPTRHHTDEADANSFNRILLLLLLLPLLVASVNSKELFEPVFVPCFNPSKPLRTCSERFLTEIQAHAYTWKWKRDERWKTE